MLVLSRLKNETVTIGRAGQVLTKPIVVMVVKVKDSERGMRTRLGFDAQQDIGIHRTELLNADGELDDSRDTRPPTNRTESD